MRRELCSQTIAKSAACLECDQRLADRPHVVDADDLHALHCQAQRRADGRVRAVGFLVADQLAQEIPCANGRPAADSPARETRGNAPSA